MLFQSVEFLLMFLPVVYLGYVLLRLFAPESVSKVWLVLGSLYFYGFWQWSYLPILVGSILFNFGVGFLLQRDTSSAQQRGALMWFGILANLGLLFWFKYYDFFIGNINAAFGTDVGVMKLLLPLGISFFTFQNMTFLVDAKNGLAKEKNLLDYALFISFFPQLIAGPIVHHKEMMPQFKTRKPFDMASIYLGVLVFAIGLVKKVGLADTFALWADQAFAKTATVGMLEAWAGSVSYTFQLYFDFSGYCDMAIGLGLLFGIRLPENFQSPLKSHSIVDFWQRWHMSLTNFIMGYIYMPMVRWFRDINTAKILLVTVASMTIIGLWHGANWTFVVFGFYHGLGLALNNIWRQMKWPMPKLLGWVLTFGFVNVGFVIFRAESLSDAWNLISRMFGGQLTLPAGMIERFAVLKQLGARPGNWFENLGTLPFNFGLLASASLLGVLLLKNSRQIREHARMSWGTASALTMFVIIGANILLSAAHPAKFLYFNF